MKAASWLLAGLFVLCILAGCAAPSDPDPQVVARAVQATLTALPTQPPVEVTRVVIVVATPTPAAAALASTRTPLPQVTSIPLPTVPTDPPTPSATATLSEPALRATAAARLANTQAGSGVSTFTSTPTPSPTDTPMPSATPTLSESALRATAAARLANTQAGPGVPTFTPTPTPRSGYLLTAEELQLLTLLNAERRKAGKAPLFFSARLSLSARTHADDMARNNQLSHNGTDGSTYAQRIRFAGYNGTLANEAIAWGATSAADAVGWFIDDPYHNAIVLSDDYTDVGAGHAYLAGSPFGHYWVLDFGAGDPSSEPVVETLLAGPGATGVAGPAQDAEPTSTPTSQPQLAKTPGDTIMGAEPTGAACPTISTRQYQLIPMERAVTDHPDWNHGDLNLALRGYSPVDETLSLVEINGPTDGDAPLLSSVVGNAVIAGVYRVNEWNWGCGGDGCRGDPIGNPPVTLLALAASNGAEVDVPRRNAAIYGDGDIAAVLYADSLNVTLAYSRDGTVANGYAAHLSGFCVDPNLVALYQQANVAGRNGLPAVHAGDALGTANGPVLVAIRDRGAFMDPRSRKDWWR